MSCIFHVHILPAPASIFTLTPIFTSTAIALPVNLVVEVQKNFHHMPVARAIQDLVHSVILELVPRTLAVGTFTLPARGPGSDSHSRKEYESESEYAVEEFVRERIRLDDI